MTSITQRNIDARGTTSAVAVRTVTPSNGADLPDGICRGFFVGNAGGTVAFVDDTGATADIQSGANQYHPIRARRILATGTTAAHIRAFY